jgi:Na+/proline symporter
MQAIDLTFVYWLIIAIYFGFVLGIGFYLKRCTKTEEDFFLAGRKNSVWVAGQAGNISAFNTVWPCDIYHSIFNKKTSPQNLLWMGRDHGRRRHAVLFQEQVREGQEEGESSCMI